MKRGILNEDWLFDENLEMVYELYKGGAFDDIIRGEGNKEVLGIFMHEGLGERELRIWDRGEDIRLLQHLLNAVMGYELWYGDQKLKDKRLDLDGVYGPKTEAAVKVFQEYRLLSIDGVVGPRTLGELSKCFLTQEQEQLLQGVMVRRRMFDSSQVRADGANLWVRAYLGDEFYAFEREDLFEGKGVWKVAPIRGGIGYASKAWTGTAQVMRFEEGNRGKTSWFGGPNDKGDRVYGQAYIRGASSPAALYRRHPRLVEWGILRDDIAGVEEYPMVTDWRGNKRRAGTSWCLDEDGMYCAIRGMSYGKYDEENPWVFVYAPKTGRAVKVMRADYGPHPRTGRIIDLSKGALKVLGIDTDDEVIFAWG